MALASGTRAVLREPAIRRFFAGNVTSLLGDGMVGVALSFAVIDLSGSAADLGYVLSARSVPLIATLLFGGVIADRFPRRRVMIVADLARFLSQATCATLLVTGHARIWELMLLQATNGSATAVFNPAATGLMPSLVAADWLQQVNALRGMAISIGYIAGPALAGVVVTAAGPGWAIAVDAGTFAVSATQLARLHPLTTAVPRSGTTFLADLHRSWTELRSRTWLWTFIAFCSVSNTCYAMFLVLGPTVTAHSRDGSARWALLLVALGIGSLLGGMIALRIRPRWPLRTAALAVVAFPLPTLGLAARVPIAVLACLCLLAGVGITVSNALEDTAIQRHVAADAVSRVSAFELFGSLATQPLGQAAAGPLAAGVGVFPALWIAGSGHLLSALCGVTIPAVRRLPAWPEGDPAR